jgi:uncharacterized protein (DUF952 family)
METVIYKVVDKHVWAAAKKEGLFCGAQIDIKDGYIHLSSAEQLAETVAKHFAGQDDLLLVSVSVAAVAEDLKWELSRNDQRFPHLYRSLKMDDVVGEQPLVMAADGSHVMPAGLNQFEQK